MSRYRWVMAAVTGFIMTTSFISLTSFGILSGQIAQTFHINSDSVSVLGVDSFSIGLFAAFFLGNGGFFDTRIRAGVLVSQIFLIVPQFLIPLSYNLDLLVILRFFQGLTIMMLALFSIQLSGWFRPDERAKSLAFTLGAITLGSAAGGVLSGILRSFSWEESYYMTGVVMIAGAAVYFAFAKDAPAQKKLMKNDHGIKHKSAWKNPMTWIMGIIQLPISWTLFSIGGFLSIYSRHLGYSSILTEYLIIAWGISGFFAAFVGAIIGDKLSKEKNSSRGILNSRLKVMTLADILMGIGALLMFLMGSFSYYVLLFAA
ncbi:MAG: MFS transporter, partial [Thermoplasmata archaeon]